ncbi:hypothetical protein ACIHAX_09810 [Nocardia sp. NPDC051929]|uniref:hypothetical protein n=1 Tax=Nocardia sp. NPDC051929 TaxID=3364327 RepID=UPI0037C6C30C
MQEKASASAPSAKVQVRPWVDRAAGGLPLFPGSYAKWLDLLKSLLAALSVESDIRTQIAWPADGEYTTVGDASKTISRSGLISVSKSVVKLTKEGEHWLASGDNEYLAAVFHGNIRFIGELLSVLSENGPTTHEELWKIADAQYRLKWRTVTQIRNRTTWLRLLGMVDFYGGRLYLTESGKRVLERVENGSPTESERVPSLSISDPSPAVAQLLKQMTDERLARRSRQLYIPRGSGEKGKLEIIATLAKRADPTVETAALTEFCAREFGINADSAESVLISLRSLGVIARSSSKSHSITPAAKSWLASGDPLDLARIAHSNVWYFGELLHELDNPDIGHNPKELAKQSNRYHPDGRGVDRTLVGSRITILIACGLVEKLARMDYRATPLGRLFRTTIRCQDPTHSSDIRQPASSDITEPIVTEGGGEAATSQPRADTADSLITDPIASDIVSLMATASPAMVEAQDIADELEAASRDSRENFARFEYAAVAAFNYLGMPSTHLGAPGRADGIVYTEIGVKSRKLALETKSSAKGSVSEESANLLALPEHREKEGAAFTLLIGPGFDRRLLEAADKDPKISAILAPLLAEAVRRQSVSPLTLDQLAPLIDPNLKCGERQEALLKLWMREARRCELEQMLVRVLEEEALNPFHEDGWLDTISIRRELRRHRLHASEEEVLDGLEFLTSSRICAVEKSTNGYRCSMPSAAIARRVQAIGRQWQRV